MTPTTVSGDPNRELSAVTAKRHRSAVKTYMYAVEPALGSLALQAAGSCDPNNRKLLPSSRYKATVRCGPDYSYLASLTGKQSAVTQSDNHSQLTQAFDSQL